MEDKPVAAPTPGHRPGDRRRTAFVSLTVAFSAFLYVFSPFSSLLLGWFVDFDDNISHRVHEITFGMLLAMVLVGVVVQLRSPEHHIAGIQQAVAVVLILTVVVTASTGWESTSLMYLVPVVAMALLHPARHEILRPRIRPAGGLFFLMVMLTFPVLVAFFEEFAKAENNVRFHQAHWGGMAAFGLSILVTGYLAALRVRGWPVAAWTTGIAMLVFGTASLLFRFDASARPDFSGVLVLIWAIVWLVAVERARLGAAHSPALAELEPSPDSPGAVMLRRKRRGRLIGGVASGLAGYLGVTVLFVRLLFVLSSFFVVGLVVYVIAWVRIPLEAPGEIVAVRTGFGSPAVGKRRSRLIFVTPMVALALLLGVCSDAISSSFAPPVPHVIESVAAFTCVECHSTGDEFAPIIDPLTHNYYEEGARSSPPFCGECHALPAVETALGRVGEPTLSSGAYALSDGFRQDHPDMFLLDEGDMAHLVSLAGPPGARP